MTGIQMIVASYVRLGNIAALLKMRQHRENLLSDKIRADHPGYALPRESCTQDLAAIDEGLNEAILQLGVRGYVDKMDGTLFAGWAQFEKYGELPVRIGIYCDGQLTAEVLANQFRIDLKKPHLGSGHHGFSYKPPAGMLAQFKVIEICAQNGVVLDNGMWQQPPRLSDPSVSTTEPEPSRETAASAAEHVLSDKVLYEDITASDAESSLAAQ